MPFEMQVVSNTPLSGEEDFDTAAKMFFEQIGYLSKGSDPTIPYKIFADFFLRHPTKAWFVDDIAATIKTSRRTRRLPRGCRTLLTYSNAGTRSAEMFLSSLRCHQRTKPLSDAAKRNPRISCTES